MHSHTTPQKGVRIPRYSALGCRLMRDDPSASQDALLRRSADPAEEFIQTCLPSCPCTFVVADYSGGSESLFLEHQQQGGRKDSVPLTTVKLVAPLGSGAFGDVSVAQSLADPSLFFAVKECRPSPPPKRPSAVARQQQQRHMGRSEVDKNSKPGPIHKDQYWTVEAMFASAVNPPSHYNVAQYYAPLRRILQPGGDYCARHDTCLRSYGGVGRSSEGDGVTYLLMELALHGTLEDCLPLAVRQPAVAHFHHHHHSATTTTAATAQEPYGIQGGMVPEDTLVSIFIQLLQGLAELARYGVLHRDVKPQNVLVRWLNCSSVAAVPQLEICLADFGVSRVVEDPNSFSTERTVVGTRAFVAPEVLERWGFQGGGAPYDHRADVWSAAAMLYSWIVRGDFQGLTRTPKEVLLVVCGELPTLMALRHHNNNSGDGESGTHGAGPVFRGALSHSTSTTTTTAAAGVSLAGSMSAAAYSTYQADGFVSDELAYFRLAQSRCRFYSDAFLSFLDAAMVRDPMQRPTAEALLSRITTGCCGLSLFPSGLVLEQAVVVSSSVPHMHATLLRVSRRRSTTGASAAAMRPGSLQGVVRVLIPSSDFGRWNWEAVSSAPHFIAAEAHDDHLSLLFAVRDG